MTQKFTLNDIDYHSFVLQLLIENKAMLCALRKLVETDICSRKPERCKQIHEVVEALYLSQIQAQITRVSVIDENLGDWIKEQLGL